MENDGVRIPIHSGRRITVECEFSLVGSLYGGKYTREFKFDPGAQNTCIAARDIRNGPEEEDFIEEFKPKSRFVASGIDDKSEIVYYQIMTENLSIAGVCLGSVPLYVTFDERFSKRLLGLDLINLLNCFINNDDRVLEITKTERLKQYLKEGKAVTTEEMIRMGLYDPRFDMDHFENIE